MANPTFDAVGTPSGIQTTSPFSFTHVMGSVSNGILVVTLAYRYLTTAPTSMAVTYNSVAMTQRRTDDGTFSGGVHGKTELWTLANPSSGSHSVSVSWSGTVVGIEGSSVSFSGASQSGVDAVGGAGSTTDAVSFTLTSVASNVAIVTVYSTSVGSDSPTQPTGYTAIYNTSNASLSTAASYKTDVASGAHTISWTAGDLSGGSAASGVSIAPPSGRLNHLPFMGVA